MIAFHRLHSQLSQPLGPTAYLGVASLFWFLSEYKKAVDNIYRLFFGKHCEVFAGVTTHDICRFDKLFFWRHNETFVCSDSVARCNHQH